MARTHNENETGKHTKRAQMKTWKRKKKAKLQYTRKLYTLYNVKYIELYREHVDKV